LSRRSPRSKNPFVAEDHAKIASLWNDRFGTPLHAFAGFTFFRRAKTVWAFCDARLPKLSYESIGLRLMSFKEEPWKPTSSALQVFGRFATKNTAHLTSEQAKVFMEGRSQPLVLEAECGYVVVFYNGVALGCGLYSHGRLVSQLPKECRVSGGEELDI
jgi:NOL1/NOP2/fmu family ribosome biogenesis protein